jgi:hypothetical protein
MTQDIQAKVGQTTSSPKTGSREEDSSVTLFNKNDERMETAKTIFLLSTFLFNPRTKLVVASSLTHVSFDTIFRKQPLTSLSCSLNAVFPSLKMRDQLCLRYCKKITHFIISIAVLENEPPDRVTEKSHLFTLNIGLAGTGNRTRATCVASSGTNRSAINYA